MRIGFAIELIRQEDCRATFDGPRQRRGNEHGAAVRQILLQLFHLLASLFSWLGI
jgi:hypothetical protein